MAKTSFQSAQAADARWRMLGLIAMLASFCLATAPARASDASASSAVSAGSVQFTDFDDIEPLQPGSAVTFGRALDLQGNPLRAILPVRQGARGAFAVGSRTGPAVRPYGLPVRTQGITSGFGTRWHPILGGYRFHTGLDLAAPSGAAVVATSPGTIMAAGWCGGYGLCVTIDHGGGLQTLYGHLSRIDVSPGQNVSSGQAIGLVGSTGRSTGPHLHYEVRINGLPVNPAGFLK